MGCILPSEALHIFDPRRNFQTQGITGRGATTTMHHATETGVSVSGIFQAAEDFAVLGWWNTYDYFSPLRLKHRLEDGLNDASWANTRLRELHAERELL